MACGCPASPLAVGECGFACEHNGRTLVLPGREEKWGWRHRFRVDSRRAYRTSDMLQHAYAWELSEVTLTLT